MATDLIASIQRFITPDVVGRIAAGLGDDKNNVNRAASAAVPAILAGLAGLADKPDGAQKISNVLQQSPVTLDEVTNSVTGTEQRSIADHGASVLSTLLGGNTMKSLAAAITNYAGVGQGSGKSILGLLAPIVLGVLGQRQRASGLDAGGIASLLASQKSAIADAMPQDFARQLAGSGVLDSLGLDASAAQAGVRTPDIPAYERGPTMSEPRSSNWSGWALAALAAVAVAGVYWLVTGPQTDEFAQQTAPTEGRAVATPEAPTTAAIARQAMTSVEGLRLTLQDMTIPGSGQAALPKLRNVASEIDKLSAQTAQLPAEGKKQVAGIVSSAMPAINSLVEKVLADPTLAEMARPVIEPIRAKLASLSAV